MEAMKKQAAKLREQVSKQQQAIMKQLRRFSNEGLMFDEADIHCYRKLQKLYSSTTETKHFHRDIVRGVKGFISTSLKQVEIGRKLVEDCCKYSNENQSTSLLARASIHFGTSHRSMEKERETLLGILADQVSEPLKVLITGTPLEEARLLTHHYDKVRQEVESLAAEVLRHRSKLGNSTTSESSVKLQHAETKLTERKSTMTALGREAITAMSAVDAQQQQITSQRLRLMVDAERSYHQKIVAILDKLHAEMILVMQLNESPLQSVMLKNEARMETCVDKFDDGNENQIDAHFLAKVDRKAIDVSLDGWRNAYLAKQRD